MRSILAGRLHSHLASEQDPTGARQEPSTGRFFSNAWRDQQGAGQMHLSTR